METRNNPCLGFRVPSPQIGITHGVADLARLPTPSRLSVHEAAARGPGEVTAVS